MADIDKENYDYNKAKDQCENILNNLTRSKNLYERNCELRFNLNNATWNQTSKHLHQGIWSKIGCFFKILFGKSC